MCVEANSPAAGRQKVEVEYIQTFIAVSFTLLRCHENTTHASEQQTAKKFGRTRLLPFLALDAGL